MKIKTKKSIKIIKRVEASIQKRNLFFNMDRNERVDEFPKSVINKCIKNIQSSDMRLYPNNFYLYKKISSWLGFSKKNILLTDGAEGSLMRFFSVFANPHDKVIYLDPSFGMYKLYCDIFKLKKYLFKINISKNFNYFEQLVKYIKKVKPKILLIANPNQPIETMLNLNQIKKLCKITKNINSFLVIDEAYYHFNNVSAQRFVKKFNNIVVIRTFSKAFGLAGLRIGYCLSNSKIIDCMKTIKPVYEINSVNIKILTFFLDNLQIMKRYVHQVSRSKRYLYKFFKKSHVEIFGKYSNTVLMKFKDSREANLIAKKLYNKKFAVKKIKINNKSNFIRCTLGTIFITKKFCKIIKENL